jgi:hypothetical protein
MSTGNGGQRRDKPADISEAAAVAIPRPPVTRFAHCVVFEQRYGWARAYRDGRLVAGRVRLTVDHDVGVGLASRERRRRSLRASFTERVDPALRAELVAVARRGGAAARRAADRMQPIELVIDNPHRGRERIVGRVLPPQQHRGDLDEIEFGLQEEPPS